MLKDPFKLSDGQINSNFQKNGNGAKRFDGKVLIACLDDECRNNLLKLVSGKGLFIYSVWEDADLLLEVLERDYDVIIYDLDLSSFNGLKMVKIIRKIRPKVSLVVISKDPCKELGGKVLQEGVAYYAVKPINPEAVQEALYTMFTWKKTN